MSPHFIGVCLFLAIIVLNLTVYGYSPALGTLQTVLAPVLLLSCFKPLCSNVPSRQTVMSSLVFMGFFVLGRQVHHDNAH